MPETIKVFCRLRPSVAEPKLSRPPRTNHVAALHASAPIVYNIDETSDKVQHLSLTVPNTTTESQQAHRFRFHDIMRPDATQAQVFERVALPVVKSCLDGYNGCVFAYGQTGSGKTFTMTGGGESYDDRGIIPRTLHYLYREIVQRPLSADGESDLVTMTVSYIEIYNDNGYDLLNPSFRGTKQDSPRIQLFDDAQQVFMKNVSMHPIASEKEALDFLLLGDMNRAIADTPMNETSTRSHCIFTLYISARNPTLSTVRQSKLHLVDLAGSERVYKSQIDGRILTEAKHINLSLHHLEQVIIALSENPNGHIPYRNSMMTSILRDSIGGNCMTTMIATLSMESANFGETISTCRFAQRVALVKNTAVINKVVDPQLVVEQLRKEIDVLRQQLIASGGFSAGKNDGELSEENANELRKRVERYFRNRRPNSGSSGSPSYGEAIAYAAEQLKLPLNWEQIYFCFHAAREEYKFNSKKSSASELSESDLEKLRNIVRQRDAEIAVLVKLLKKEKERAKSLIIESQPKSESSRPSSAATFRSALSSTETLGNVAGAENGKKFSVAKHEAWRIFQREHPEKMRAVNHIDSLVQRKSEESKVLAQKLGECRAEIEKFNVSSASRLDNKQPTASFVENELALYQTRTQTLFKCLRRCKAELDYFKRQRQQMVSRMQHEFELCWQTQLTASSTTSGCTQSQTDNRVTKSVPARAITDTEWSSSSCSSSTSDDESTDTSSVGSINTSVRLGSDEAEALQRR